MLILIGWQHFYAGPKARESEQRQHQQTSLSVVPEQHTTLTREQALLGQRIKINGDKVQGSISLLGARLDDVSLKDYRSNAGPVTLLSPAQTDFAYFAELGWFSPGAGIEWPSSKTLWKASKQVLRSNDHVVLSWTNRQNITFQLDIGLDANYLFTVKQTILNQSSKPIAFQSYGLINRTLDNPGKSSLAHEGPIGVFNKLLKEEKYSDLDSKQVTYTSNQSGGWLGISDKYWLVSMIPAQNFDAKFHNARANGRNKYQVDYMSSPRIINAGSKHSDTTHLFVGAKVESLLNEYGKQLKLDLFDRAIDFGWFYFLTKPLLKLLEYCYIVVGNFGLSIMLVTVLIKILLLPMTNNSYRAMNKMKKLQPEMERIRALHAEDKMKQHQAIMELYKREKINPLAGFLLLLVQIPIFFSLYKILFVTIEMRQAPFYGWIHDLSAPDPTTIFNLFGLIPWTPPSFLMIGALPIIMALTQYLQQRMSPAPSDNTQAQVMKFLPLIFLFMFASFPAGLVLYWAWSNVLSIAQQYFMQPKRLNSN
jgi:YidC/Oxa1 family membrane protein insertase